MSNARTLIEDRAKSMGHVRHTYRCEDTSMVFSTMDFQATRSPFTGTDHVKLIESRTVEADSFMTPSDVPANQKNQQVQTPLSPNPAPDSPPADWQNSPWSANPAPDDSGKVGSTQAGPDGFVPYPQSSVG